MTSTLIILLCTVILLPCLRLLYLLYTIWRRRQTGYTSVPSPHYDSVHMMAVLGSGGHTKEMLVLINSLGSKFTPRSYVIADNDRLSIEKVKDMQLSATDVNYRIYSLPRSRVVHQSFISSIFTSLRAFLSALPIVARAKPDVLIVNGPGTCIPILFSAFIMNLCYISDTKIVYVESICRVSSLSLSGKLAYYFADSFIVQWPELAQLFPMAFYKGRLL